MTIIEQIKAEIERQIKDPQEHCYGVSSINKLRELLDFIGTLEVEKPNQDELEEDLTNEADKMFFSLGFYEGDHHQPMLDCISLEQFQGIARHFAQWGAEHSGSSEIPNYLNELADYARRQVEELLPVIKKYNDYSEEQIEELRTHLMAMFLEGAGWQKEQMMEDAVEGEVVQDLKGVNRVKSFGKIPKGLHFGDKVRIIIVKD